jgi:hypothetical protein
MRHLLILALCVVPKFSAPEVRARSAPETRDRIVLKAQPATRVIADASNATRTDLSVSEAEQNQILIMERNGRYYWTSRAGPGEDRELTHVVSGAYHFFIDVRGGGYVKVVDQRKLSPGFTSTGPDIQYLEHITNGLMTLTYWGNSDRFEP